MRKYYIVPEGDETKVISTKKVFFSHCETVLQDLYTPQLRRDLHKLRFSCVENFLLLECILFSLTVVVLKIFEVMASRRRFLFLCLSILDEMVLLKRRS